MTVGGTGRPVACCHHGNAKATFGGVADRGDDILDGHRRDDHRRLVLDREVVAPSLGVIVGMEGGEEISQASSLPSHTRGNNDDVSIDR